MKRILAMLLAVASALSLCACGTRGAEPTEATEEATIPHTDYVVATPMKRPDYSVPENATTDDLRSIAVRAMGDLVGINWTADDYWTYRNPYDAVTKQFQYAPGSTYAGVPYTNAHVGIFQWFAYYNEDTGVVTFPGNGQAWSEALGTVCADCIFWAWSTVCNSMGGNFNTFTMTPGHNMVPVGGYTASATVTDYREYNTDRIIAENGEETIAKCYMQVLPADALVSTPDGHAIMAIEKPKIVYTDGKLDMNLSYITVRDQRGDIGSRSKQFVEDGVNKFYTGRMSCEYTFRELIDQGYIPMTTKEFAGEKPYEKATASYTGETDTLEHFLGGTVNTNFLLASLEVLAVQADGNTRRADIALYKKADTAQKSACNGLTYDLKKLSAEDISAALKDGDTALRLVATTSDGSTFELAEYQIKEG